MNNTKVKGFSLIELMVVIAIVGVLAAVAIPSYKTYLIKTKLGSLAPVLDSLMNKSMVYANTNAAVPTAAQLGLSPTSNSYVVDNPSTLNKYITSMNILSSVNVDNGMSCLAIQTISGNLDVAALGFPSSTATTGSFNCYLFNGPGNSYVKSCAVYFQDGGSNYVLGLWIPNWYACLESTCSNPRPYYQQKDGYGPNPRFTSAICP